MNFHTDFTDLAVFLFRYYYVVHQCTKICGIRVISVKMKNSADIDSHADFADLADFLFRCYYVVYECTIDLRNQREKKYSAWIFSRRFR